MDGIAGEAFGLCRPCPADHLVGREVAQGLQAPGEIAGVEIRGEMVLELPVGIVVMALDGRLFGCAVHPLRLPIGPRVVGLGQAMLGAVAPVA